MTGHYKYHKIKVVLSTVFIVMRCEQDISILEEVEICKNIWMGGMRLASVEHITQLFQAQITRDSRS
jgi:hypothetical protein